MKKLILILHPGLVFSIFQEAFVCVELVYSCYYLLICDISLALHTFDFD